MPGRNTLGACARARALFFSRSRQGIISERAGARARALVRRTRDVAVLIERTSDFECGGAGSEVRAHVRARFFFSRSRQGNIFERTGARARAFVRRTRDLAVLIERTSDAKCGVATL